MKLTLPLLAVLVLVPALSSCVVAPSPTPVVVSGTTSGWEGAAATAYVGGVTAGMVGSSYYSAPYYGAPYYRSAYYAPTRAYYGGYHHVGHGHNINGGVNRVGRR